MATCPKCNGELFSLGNGEWQCGLCGRKFVKKQKQPQAAETQTAQGQQPAQEGQAQAKPEKPNLIADSDVDWKELEQFGVKRENLSEKDMKALMNYGKTRLVTVEPVLGGER